MNKKFLRTLVASALPLIAATALHAEETNANVGEADKIAIMLEYNTRMVNITENYLKERERIPEAYRGVTDHAFLERAKNEKPAKSADAQMKKLTRGADPVVQEAQVTVYDHSLRGRGR